MKLTHNLKPGTTINTIFGEYVVDDRQGDQQYVMVVDAYNQAGCILPSEITGIVSEPDESDTERDSAPRPGVLPIEAVLAAAADHCLSVDFVYSKKDGLAQWRSAVPHGFKTTSKGNRVLVAYDDDRQDIRTFKLDRINAEDGLMIRVPASEG